MTIIVSFTREFLSHVLKIAQATSSHITACLYVFIICNAGAYVRKLKPIIQCEPCSAAVSMD